MEKNIPQNLEKVLFDKPIAGQSLTNSPENKYAWEQAPKYTSVKDAREAIFLNLLEPQTLKSVQELMIYCPFCYTCIHCLTFHLRSNQNALICSYIL